MNDIKIHNVIYREDAEALRRLLEGKTYMNLEVRVAPAGGSFDVWVGTGRPGTSEEELRDMVMAVLVSCALDMGSAPVLRALAEGCRRLDDGDQNDIRAARVTDGRVLEHFKMVRRNLTHEPVEEASAGYIGGRYAWVNAAGQWVCAVGEHICPVEAGVSLYADPDCTVVLRTV